MKRIIGIILTTTSYATAAMSNGTVISAPTQAPQKGQSWGGFKIGMQVGYGTSNNHMDIQLRARAAAPNRFLKISGDSTSAGFLGGLHGGWDFPFNGHWLVGLETFIDYSGLNGKVKHRDNVVARLPYGVKSSIEMDWSVGFMARAGYITNDTLFYAGIGWVGSKWKLESSFFDVTFPAGVHINPHAHKHKFINGLRLAVGAGERYDQWLLGLEASYTFYGKKSHKWSYAENGDSGFIDMSHKMKPCVLDAKVKVSYMLQSVAYFLRQTQVLIMGSLSH